MKAIEAAVNAARRAPSGEMLSDLTPFLLQNQMPPSWTFEIAAEAWDIVDLWRTASPDAQVPAPLLAYERLIRPLMRQLADIVRPTDPPLALPPPPSALLPRPLRHPLSFTEADAAAWLKRARDENGYFVPNKNVIPCTIVRGCMNVAGTGEHSSEAGKPHQQPAQSCFMIGKERFCQ